MKLEVRLWIEWIVIRIKIDYFLPLVQNVKIQFTSTTFEPPQPYYRHH